MDVNLLWKNTLVCSPAHHMVLVPGKIMNVWAHHDSNCFVALKWFHGLSGKDRPNITRKWHIYESYPGMRFSYEKNRNRHHHTVEYISVILCHSKGQTYFLEGCPCILCFPKWNITCNQEQKGTDGHCVLDVQNICTIRNVVPWFNKSGKVLATWYDYFLPTVP